MVYYAYATFHNSPNLLEFAMCNAHVLSVGAGTLASLSWFQEPFMFMSIVFMLLAALYNGRALLAPSIANAHAFAFYAGYEPDYTVKTRGLDSYNMLCTDTDTLWTPWSSVETENEGTAIHSRACASTL